MTHVLALAAAVGVLAGSWIGPLPGLARESFAAHMTLHMAVVAIAAPLLALAVAGTHLDPVRVAPRLLAPLPASLIELVAVWAWHMPALHEAARHETGVFVIEQGTFAAAGFLLWIAAIGGHPAERGTRAPAGVVALLLTSMHMTLLGALFALAPRPLFAHAAVAEGSNALGDQQFGGVIMLLVGGAAYLFGGLWLTATALRRPPPRRISEERLVT